MDDRGNIERFKTAAEARAAGFNIPLTEAEAKKLGGITVDRRVETHVTNRHERRKQEALLRKAGKEVRS